MLITPSPRRRLSSSITGSKLFQGFRAAARASAKAAGGASFAISAASKFEKGKYTNDAVADALKLTAPSVYVQPADGAPWAKCKTGRPTETSPEQMQQAITGCVAAAQQTGKAEL